MRHRRRTPARIASRRLARSGSNGCARCWGRRSSRAVDIIDETPGGVRRRVPEANARTDRLGDNGAMIALTFRCGFVGLLAGLSSAAARVRHRDVPALRLRRGEEPQVHRALRAVPARRASRDTFAIASGRSTRTAPRRRWSSNIPRRARTRSSGSTLRRILTAACIRSRCASSPATSATPYSPGHAARKPWMPASKCVTAGPARRQSSHAASGPAFTSSSSRGSSRAIPKRPSAPRA